MVMMIPAPTVHPVVLLTAQSPRPKVAPAIITPRHRPITVFTG